MTGLTRTLLIRSSPHAHSGGSVDAIMRHVALALLPACGFALFHFGLSALATLLTACAVCLLAERGLAPRLATSRQPGVSLAANPQLPSVVPGRLGDGSALVTGLLFGMTLPPSLPLWMVAVGGLFGMAVGKWLLGGLGSNPFNPALVGRAFLQAAFPAAMTAWPAPPENRWLSVHPSTFAWPLTQPNTIQSMGAGGTDGVTAATPLASFKFDGQLTATSDLWWGTVGGSLGETSAILILIGGLYLAIRRLLDWRIPATILVTVAALSWLLNGLAPERCPGPLFMLGAGGLMLGAVFMATDMVTSPITHRGRILFAALIGLLVVVIRVWGGMPEGVMYAILLGNATVPLIDRAIRPTVYGTRAVGPWPRPDTAAATSHATSLATRTAGVGSDPVAARAVAGGGGASGKPPVTLSAGPPVGRVYGVVLAIGGLCSLGIVAADRWTEPIIARKRAEYRRQAVLAVLPGAIRSVAFRAQPDGSFAPVEAAAELSAGVFAGYDASGRLVGLALEAEGQGYQDRIRMLYGYSPDSQAILAIRLLESRETPGLGDRVETDPGFQANFGNLDARVSASGESIANPIVLVGAGQRTNAWEMDGITGATVTSRAVATMLRDSTAARVPELFARRADFTAPPPEPTR